MFKPIFSNYKIIINNDEKNFLLISDSNVQYQGQCRDITNLKNDSRLALINLNYFDLIEFITNINEGTLLPFYNKMKEQYNNISSIKIYIWNRKTNKWNELFNCNDINDIVLLQADLTEDKSRGMFYGEKIELTFRIFYNRANKGGEK